MSQERTPVPEEVRRALSYVGSIRTEKKAAASRLNGKLGGGQFKPLADIPCTCGAPGDSLEHKSTCLRGRTIRRRQKLGQPLT